MMSCVKFKIKTNETFLFIIIIASYGFLVIEKIETSNGLLSSKSEKSQKGEKGDKEEGFRLTADQQKTNKSCSTG